MLLVLQRLGAASLRVIFLVRLSPIRQQPVVRLAPGVILLVRNFPLRLQPFVRLAPGFVRLLFLSVLDS